MTIEELAKQVDELKKSKEALEQKNKDLENKVVDLETETKENKNKSHLDPIADNKYWNSFVQEHKERKK